LARTGLPVRLPRRPQPLREEPVVADLLTIVEIGVQAAGGGAEIDPQLAAELLRGPFGDADSLRLRRIRRLLLAAHRDADPEQAIWQVWEAAGLATGWRRAALGAPGDVDGARARMAGGRLDALMELFAAAERLTDRRPGAGALDLVEQVRSQAVVEDTL